MSTRNKEIDVLSQYDGDGVKSLKEFKIPAASKELYVKTREALAKEGYFFIVDILPVSIGKIFGYTSENMRATVPPQMEVVINPKKLTIGASSSWPSDQRSAIEKEEAALKARLPQEIRDLVGMPMQNTSVLMQIDDVYKEYTGKVLFTNWRGRTYDDQTSPGDSGSIGRSDPTSEIWGHDWNRGNEPGHVFAVPVVVLPRKLTV